MQFAEERSVCMDSETKKLLDYIRQWEEKNPGEEIVFITLPKFDRKERKRVLELAVKFLSKNLFTEPGYNGNCDREE